MRKYEVRFCGCGRVHFLENEKIEKACASGKSFVCICNNCGKASEIWYTECLEGCCVNSASIRDREIQGDEIGVLVCSSGEKIWMKTGSEATAYVQGRFIDWECGGGDTLFDYDTHKRVVDVEKTIRMISDEEKLKALSSMGVEIDWSGTKYKRYW